MLQVAYGGRKLSTDYYFNSNFTYGEPGFILMEPLSLSSDEADYIYLLFRKRTDNTGVNFDSIFPEDFEVTATDETSGESLSSYIYEPNEINTDWDSGNVSVGYDYLVCSIQSELSPSSPVKKIQVMSCYLKDKNDGSFIRFRIVMDVQKYGINYLKVDTKSMDKRNPATSYASEIYSKLNPKSSSYIIISPEDYISETDSRAEADFSYPVDTIFYRSYGGFNKEEYDFSISSYYPSFVGDYISVMNIPNFGRACVLLIDRGLYSEISSISSSTLTIYATINVVGKRSEAQNNYIVKFIL